MNEDTWFDNIGLAFARSAQEVETARESFIATRETLMEKLSELLLKRAGERRVDLQQLGIKREGLNTWHGFDARGKYRIASGRKYATLLGFGFCQGDFWTDGSDIPFGFYTYIYIKMNKPEAERICLESKLQDFSPNAVELRHGGGFSTYLIASQHHPGAANFTRKSLSTAVGTLVEIFPRTDERLAAAIK